MDLLSFVVTVVLITASGALAPGPLFFQTISQGIKMGARSGFIFSIAHTVVEFSVIMVLALGLFVVRNEHFIQNVLGVLGGVVLIIFGVYQIVGSLKKNDINQKQIVSSHRLFLIGILFTLFNPYFIVWWLTVGSNLILLALEFAAFAGVVLMFLCHVWIDYAWLIAVAYFAKRGANALSSNWYRTLIAVFGAILIYFGVLFLGDTLIW